jgi:hypothetical protein
LTIRENCILLCNSQKAIKIRVRKVN